MEENDNKTLENDIKNLKVLISILKEENDKISKRIEEKEKYLKILEQN